jgi:hypothetical protein
VIAGTKSSVVTDTAVPLSGYTLLVAVRAKISRTANTTTNTKTPPKALPPAFDAPDAVGMAMEGPQWLFAVRVPQTDGVVGGAAGDSFAVGAEADAPHPVGMPFEGENLGPLLRVPDLHLAWDWWLSYPR